jgi:hypothetical protein
MRHIVFRIFFCLVLIAAIAGIALLAYNAGVSHGTAINTQTPTIQNGGPSYPAYGMPFWWPFPFLGFGFFGVLALLFLLSVAFGAARLMLWGPRFGWHRMQRRHGFWGDQGSGEDIPPMFAEMHRRMHAADEGKPADQGTQKVD